RGSSLPRLVCFLREASLPPSAASATLARNSSASARFCAARDFASGPSRSSDVERTGALIGSSRFPERRLPDPLISFATSGVPPPVLAYPVRPGLSGHNLRGAKPADLLDRETNNAP